MKGNRIFSKKFGLILLLPSALIFLLVSVYPLCTGLILSFQNNSLFSSDQANFIGIQNFISILSTDTECLFIRFRIFLTVKFRCSLQNIIPCFNTYSLGHFSCGIEYELELAS